MGVLAWSDFNQNDLDIDFDSYVDDSGDLAIDAAAALCDDSRFGLKAVIDDTTDIYGVRTIFDGFKRERHYLDPNGLAMSNGDSVAHLLFLDGASERGVVQLYYNGSNYQVRAGWYEDGAGSPTFTGYITITDAPHFLELRLVKASNSTALDGTLTLTVDRTGGMAQATGLDVFDITDPDRYHFGAMNISAGVSGTLYLDQLIVKDDDVEIGACIVAFPSAEGAGALENIGGRGGAVVKVTNTNDTGGGSLRAALEDDAGDGPRMVIIETSGYIDLQSPIEISEPYCTIDGATAPGDGIVIRKNRIRVQTHNVVIRNLDVWPTDEFTSGANTSNAIMVNSSPGITETDTDRTPHSIIVDRCSLFWCEDTMFSLFHSDWDQNNPSNNTNLAKIRRMTLQWTILAEALSNAGHPEGEHSKNLLMSQGATEFSCLHNLFAHCFDRNPQVKGGDIDYRYNTGYNINKPPRGGRSNAGIDLFRCNAVGNYERGGPNSLNAWFLQIQPGSDGCDPVVEAAKPDHKVYASDNKLRDEGGVDDWDDFIACNYGSGGGPADDTKHKLTSPILLPGSAVSSYTQEGAYDELLTTAGRRYPTQLAPSSRVINEVQLQTGSIVDTQGTMPSLTGGSPGTDTSGDGIPDAWKTLMGLTVGDDNSATRLLHTEGIYTDLEMYQFDLNGEMPGASPPGGGGDPITVAVLVVVTVVVTV